MVLERPRHIWKADEYRSHSAAQYVAATHVLQLVELQGHEQILDIGCGDGKITATLAGQVSAGSVLGIDVSAEMIQFAQNLFPKATYTNLQFLVKDAQCLSWANRFDVVFSSFALQWMPDQKAAFTNIYNGLKSGGRLAVTIPLGISRALQSAIDLLIKDPAWSLYFNAFSPGWYFPSPHTTMELLIAHGFTLNHFEIVSQEEFFQSREEFEAYVAQWLSYLSALPKYLQHSFLQQVIDQYLQIEPALVNGNVRFVFSRLDAIATKSDL